MSSTTAPKIDNDVYNRMSDTWWDENGFLHLLKSIVNPWRVPYFRRILVELEIGPQNKGALDVGCGGGLLAEEFAAIGFAVTGIDPSDKSLEVARAHAAHSGLQIDYRLGYGDTLPFENESFEVAFCCDVLEHIHNWDAVIGEIARVLKPGGVFFYDTINRTTASKLLNIKIAQEWKFTRVAPANCHVWEMFITPNELKASLKRHGLQNRDLVGSEPSVNPIKALILLLQYRWGKISAAEMGKRFRLNPGKDLSGSYMGYAIKP